MPDEIGRCYMLEELIAHDNLLVEFLFLFRWFTITTHRFVAKDK